MFLEVLDALFSSCLVGSCAVRFWDAMMMISFMFTKVGLTGFLYLEKEIYSRRSYQLLNVHKGTRNSFWSERHNYSRITKVLLVGTRPNPSRSTCAKSNNSFPYPNQ